MNASAVTSQGPTRDPPSRKRYVSVLVALLLVWILVVAALVLAFLRVGRG